MKKQKAVYSISVIYIMAFDKMNMQNIINFTNWNDMVNKLNIKNTEPSEPYLYLEVEWTKFLVDGVVLTAVSLFGIIGTLMSIRVLILPQLRSNAFSALLVYLAICDTNFLLFAVLTIGLKEVSFW